MMYGRVKIDRDYEPNVHSQFQFFVDYKGIKIGENSKLFKILNGKY